MVALTQDVKALMGRIKVLIVDDEHYTRKTIRTLLLSLGCIRIHEAEDGASGLAAMRLFAPDIVLLDWEMPGVDGADFVRRMRSEMSASSHVPIIMLTGHDERSRVLQAMSLGVHEFLLKPVSISALQARILSALTNPRAILKRSSAWSRWPGSAERGQRPAPSGQDQSDIDRPRLDYRGRVPAARD
jgi:DNA-binding response OmpR family regulator